VRSISDALTKTSTSPTPMALKVVIVLEMWFLLSGLVTTLNGPLMQGQPLSGWIALAVGMVALQIVLLIGIWKLRKWAVLVLGCIVALGVLQTALLTDAGGQAILALLVLRGIVLVPAVVYWRRMTW
jgi:hypothetical protein